MSNASDFIIENGVLTKYVGPGGDVVIPEGVTTIGSGAFSYSMLSSVTIPEGVTHIERDAFAGNRFTSVVLPQSLEEIGANAFGLCLGLTEISIPDSVTRIGSKAFNHCVALEHIVVGSSVSIVGSNAFADTLWMKNQNKITVFAGNVLVYAAISDEEFTIPEGTIGIGGSAFEDCGNLKRIIVPKSVRMISSKAFAQCTALKSIKIEGNPEIAKDAIPESAMLIAREIPMDDIKSKQLKHQAVIGFFFVEDADETVPSGVLKHIIKNFDKLIPEIQRIPGLLERMLQKNTLQEDHVNSLLDSFRGNTEICALLLEYKNRHFSNGRSQNHRERNRFKAPTAAELKIIWKPTNLPNGSLEVCGYYGKDTYVVVPAMIGKKPVSEVGSCCFYVSPYDENIRKNITFIDIPVGVSVIKDRAFVGCKSLVEIHIPGTVKAIGDYAFWECQQVHIHAPAGSYAETYAKENNIPFVAE